MSVEIATLRESAHHLSQREFEADGEYAHWGLPQQAGLEPSVAVVMSTITRSQAMRPKFDRTHIFFSRQHKTAQDELPVQTGRMGPRESSLAAIRKELSLPTTVHAQNIVIAAALAMDRLDTTHDLDQTPPEPHILAMLAIHSQRGGAGLEHIPRMWVYRPFAQSMGEEELGDKKSADEAVTVGVQHAIELVMPRPHTHPLIYDALFKHPVLEPTTAVSS